MSQPDEVQTSAPPPEPVPPGETPAGPDRGKIDEALDREARARQRPPNVIPLREVNERLRKRKNQPCPSPPEA